MRLENVELQPSSGESSDMKTTALYLIKQDHRFLKFNFMCCDEYTHVSFAGMMMETLSTFLGEKF